MRHHIITPTLAVAIVLSSCGTPADQDPPPPIQQPSPNGSSSADNTPIDPPRQPEPPDPCTTPEPISITLPDGSRLDVYVVPPCDPRYLVPVPDPGYPPPHTTR